MLELVKRVLRYFRVTNQVIQQLVLKFAGRLAVHSRNHVRYSTNWHVAVVGRFSAVVGNSGYESRMEMPLRRRLLMGRCVLSRPAAKAQVSFLGQVFDILGGRRQLV